MRRVRSRADGLIVVGLVSAIVVPAVVSTQLIPVSPAVRLAEPVISDAAMGVIVAIYLLAAAASVLAGALLRERGDQRSADRHDLIDDRPRIDGHHGTATPAGDSVAPEESAMTGRPVGPPRFANAGALADALTRDSYWLAAREWVKRVVGFTPPPPMWQTHERISPEVSESLGESESSGR